MCGGRRACMGGGYERRRTRRAVGLGPGVVGAVAHVLLHRLTCAACLPEPKDDACHMRVRPPSSTHVSLSRMSDMCLTGARRLCHDEAVSTHRMDRSAVSEMVCMECGCRQVAFLCGPCVCVCVSQMRC